MLKCDAYILKAAFLPMLALFSCSRVETEDFVPTELALTAVTDTSSMAWKALSGYCDVGSAGAVAVFGAPDETAVMAEALLTADMFDNIDAKTVPDGLPDFAGETVMPVFDMTNAPYQGYFDTADEDFLRELAVNGFLSAVSGFCSSSAFDQRCSAAKPRAKILILSSSLMSLYGSRDIEYVISGAGMETCALNPVESAVSHVFSNAAQASNIGVWASGGIVSSGVYGTVFKDIRSRYTEKHSPDYKEWAAASEIVCLSPETDGSPEDCVKAFLDAYLSSDYHVPLSGIIMDDFTEAARVDSLNAALDTLLNGDSAVISAYRGAVAEGCRFVSPVETLTEDCYLWLREHDRFTHLVAYPAVSGYMTVVSSEVQGQLLDKDGRLGDDYKYNRAPGSDVETYRFIPLSQSYFSKEELHKMQGLAPETYKRLVYVY